MAVIVVLGLGTAHVVHHLPRGVHMVVTTDQDAENYPALSCIPIQVDICWNIVDLSLQFDSKQLLQTL